MINSVDEEDALPKEFALLQNYPNPFNPTTQIKFSIPEVKEFLSDQIGNSEIYVELSVYDLIGRKIKTLVKRPLRAGEYSATFNAQNLTSGIYLCKITAGEFTQERKMILLK